jgi:hypothetical protein
MSCGLHWNLGLTLGGPAGVLVMVVVAGVVEVVDAVDATAVTEVAVVVSTLHNTVRLELACRIHTRTNIYLASGCGCGCCCCGCCCCCCWYCAAALSTSSWYFISWLGMTSATPIIGRHVD